MNLVALFLQRADLTAESTALVEPDGAVVSYSRLAEAVQARKQLVSERGLGGSVVAMDAPIGGDQLALYLALLSAGCCVASIDSVDQADCAPDVAKQLGAAEATAVSDHRVLTIRNGALADALRRQNAALVLRTSGTTGTPKFVVHSHESLLWTSWRTLAQTFR